MCLLTKYRFRTRRAPTLLTVLGGEGYITCGSKRYPVHAGSSYYVRAGTRLILSGCAIAGAAPGEVAAVHAVRVGINESTAPEGGCVIS